MKKSITVLAKQSRARYEVLEEMIRLKIQGYMQDMLEEEIETFLGRRKAGQGQVYTFHKHIRASVSAAK